MKYNDIAWYRERAAKEVKSNATLSYRDKLKVFLGMSLEELKGSPVYESIKKRFPDLDDSATLDEARIMLLFDKAFVESSQKSLELMYKLDGSMTGIQVDIDFAEIEELTEDIK